jgi:hypothetical protein
MRSGSLALILVALVGCEGGVITESTEGEATDGVQTAPAGPGCVGPVGLLPPSFTLNDMLGILGKVQFFSSSPANFQLLFTGPWTNWSSEPMTTGLAKLATMRGLLEKVNLHDAYLPGGRPPAVDCTGKTGVRQADGTCNDTVDTQMGASGVRFGRNIPFFLPNPASPTGFAPNPKVYPDAANMMVPNPRVVSRKLFTRGAGGTKEVPFLNMLAAAWVQFQVHDWFDHTNSTVDYFNVPLQADDPLRRYGLSELIIARTVPAARAGAELQALPPVYNSAVTHWWDASQVYGSDKATADSLRDRNPRGLLATLKMDPTGLLPAGSDGFEQTGMRKNFWLGLGLLHNLFAKEHNAIVAKLRATHPEMDEQELYDHARLINAAVIAKIHTIEWTPAILPNPTLAVGMHANWTGLKTFMANPAADLPVLQGLMGTLPPDLAQAANQAVMGVVGNSRNLNNVPFSMTEDFVSVYRMHALMPDTIKISSPKGKYKITYPTELTRQAGGRILERLHPMNDLLYSFGIEHPGALVLQNYPKFLQQLLLPMGITDIATIDVLRDRERGIPRYNDFREQIRLKRVASIEELTPDPALQAALHEVYGADVDAINKVDALVGTLAEGTRPSCYGFGETLFQVFTLMATRRLAGDRFYTNDFRAEVYTAEGMQWIKDATMKSVLIRHNPGLASTELAGVANAFYPWK